MTRKEKFAIVSAHINVADTVEVLADTIVKTGSEKEVVVRTQLTT